MICASRNICRVLIGPRTQFLIDPSSNRGAYPKIVSSHKLEAHCARNNVIIPKLLYSRIDVNLQIVSSGRDVLFAEPVSFMHSLLCHTVCMYVCMVIAHSKVWINHVRLPILLVVS